MMKPENFYFTCYATEDFKNKQEILCTRALTAGFDPSNFLHSNRKWLETTEFYKNHKSVLDEKRGGGYWLWKPFLIYEALKLTPKYSVLLYLDSGDYVDFGVIEHLIPIMNREDMLLLGGAYKNSDWTKRDCFYYMSCDTKEYHDTIQLEAGVQVWKHTERSLDILSEQIEWCSDRRIITDDSNVCGLENLPGFKDHRHDQSVLTNLFIKYKLPVDNSTGYGVGWSNVYSGLRNYIRCNI